MSENFNDVIYNLFSTVNYLDTRPNSENLAIELENCDILVIGAKEILTEEMIKNAKKLPKVIGTLSVGVDHIAPSLFSNNEIHILNTPKANVESVAEHSLGMIYALAKKFKAGEKSVSNGTGRSGLAELPNEIYGKTLGIVGLGNIGTRLAEMGKSVGLNIISSSKTRTSGAKGEVKFYSLENVFAKSDFISLHLPLTNSSKNLISTKILSAIKPGAILINTSRPEIVDHSAIKESLMSGDLAGYGLDCEEDILSLSSLPNVLITPHIAGVTEEASARLDDELAEYLRIEFSEGD